MGISSEMPRYQCHKQVWALEIESFGEDQMMHFADKHYAARRASDDLILRYRPEPGDFFVVYDGGYESISPRAAFLDGYTRI